MENILKSSFFLLSLFILLGQEVSGGSDSSWESPISSQCIDECTERDARIEELKRQIDELRESIIDDLKELFTDRDREAFEKWLDNPGDGPFVSQDKYDLGSAAWQALIEKNARRNRLIQELLQLLNDTNYSDENCDPCPPNNASISNETEIGSEGGDTLANIAVGNSIIAPSSSGMGSSIPSAA